MENYIESFISRDDAVQAAEQILDMIDGFFPYIQCEITKIDGKWRVGIMTNNRQGELEV